MTQTQLAAQLSLSQSRVSRIEREEDVQLSTLRRYVQALGGELELRAVFPDGEDVGISMGTGTMSEATDGPTKDHK